VPLIRDQARRASAAGALFHGVVVSKPFHMITGHQVQLVYSAAAAAAFGSSMHLSFAAL
jgi:hypothetical protein